MWRNMTAIDPGPDHYVLLCARQYAATLRKYQLAKDGAERQRHVMMLQYLMEAGICEQDFERRKRERRLPTDIIDLLKEHRSLPAGRPISSEEVERISHVFAIPPFATMESLTGQDMLDLSDLYEGWAQDGRNDALRAAMLLGWADGFRTLAAEVGASYEPPPKVPGERDSLPKFIAR